MGPNLFSINILVISRQSLIHEGRCYNVSTNKSPGQLDLRQKLCHFCLQLSLDQPKTQMRFDIHRKNPRDLKRKVYSLSFNRQVVLNIHIFNKSVCCLYWQNGAQCKKEFISINIQIGYLRYLLLQYGFPMLLLVPQPKNYGLKTNS